MSEVWIVLIGVGAGALLTACSQALNHRLAKKRLRRSLALLVCPALEEFMLACQAAIDDEGHRRKGTRLPRVPMPIGPEFPDEVDWTSIAPKLAHRILSLRAAITRAEQELGYIAEEVSDPPDHEYWFSARRQRCLKLLGDASTLSTALRKIAKIPTTSDDSFDGVRG